MPNGWDVHTHLVPSAVLDWAQRSRWDLGLSEGKLHNGDAVLHRGRLEQPSELVEWTLRQQLNGAVVSVPPPLFRAAGADAQEQYTWAAHLNDALLDTCAIDDSRLRPLALLPLEDAARAFDLLQALRFRDSPFVGVVIGTDGEQLPLSADELNPVWEILSAERIPVFIHPSSCPDLRLSKFYLTNLLGNPVETSIAVAHLLFGGVLDRHDLTFVLAHGGGVTPGLVGRWQRGYETRRPGVPELVEEPRAAMRAFFIDGLVYDASTLAFVIEQFGLDRVLLGSDWPFPIAASSVADALPGLRDPAIAQIADNAVRAFPQLT